MDINPDFKNKGVFNIRFLLLITAALLVPQLISLPLYGPWTIFLLGLVVGVLTISFIEREEDRSFLFKIFIYTYLLRILIAFLLYMISLNWEFNPGFFIDDGWGYSENGSVIANRIERGLPIDHYSVKDIEGSRSGALHQYDYINGAVYFVVGKSPLSMLFLNCALGALVVIFIYLTVLLLFGNRQIAKLSTLLYAYWPSLVLWSTQNLKEPLTNFLMILSFWGFISLLKRFNPIYPILTFVGIFCLWKFRTEVANAIIISFFLHLVFLVFFLVYSVIKKELPIVLIVFLIGFFITYRFLRLLNMDILQVDAILAQIDVLRSGRATASLAILPDYHITSLKSLFLYLPVGLIVFLFAPFPWQLSSFSQIMAVPEMLVWYIMIPYTIKGVSVAIKSKARYFFSIFIFIGVISLVMIVMEGNIGTMFRHKSLIMIFLLTFMAVGIVQKKEESAGLIT